MAIVFAALFSKTIENTFKFCTKTKISLRVLKFEVKQVYIVTVHAEKKNAEGMLNCFKRKKSISYFTLKALAIEKMSYFAQIDIV